MKKSVLIVLFTAFTGVMYAQTAAQTVESLERQRFDAQVKKDYTFLEKIFADDLVYIHSGGKQDSKTTYIQSIRDGKSVYDKIDVEEIKVRTYEKDKIAVVNGVIVITTNNAPSHLRYLVVYRKDRKMGWQLNSWQSLKMAK